MTPPRSGTTRPVRRCTAGHRTELAHFRQDLGCRSAPAAVADPGSALHLQRTLCRRCLRPRCRYRSISEGIRAWPYRHRPTTPHACLADPATRPVHRSGPRCLRTNLVGRPGLRHCQRSRCTQLARPNRCSTAHGTSDQPRPCLLKSTPARQSQRQLWRCGRARWRRPGHARLVDDGRCLAGGTGGTARRSRPRHAGLAGRAITARHCALAGNHVAPARRAGLEPGHRGLRLRWRRSRTGLVASHTGTSSATGAGCRRTQRRCGQPGTGTTAEPARRTPADHGLDPHPLEAARLLQTSTAQIQANRLQSCLQLASKFQCTVLLKGSGTVVANPQQQVWINASGNARLATGGTGDVLAGLIAALWAQGQSADMAATQAAFRHGHIADCWPADLPFSASALALRLGNQ